MEIQTKNINGKNRIVGTFDIEYNGKTEKVEIKKLNYGEFNDLQRSCMKMQMLGGTPKLDVDQVAMNENSILKSIISAPFTVNLEEIRNLDREVAEVILENVSEMNTPSDKKKDN